MLASNNGDGGISDDSDSGAAKNGATTVSLLDGGVGGGVLRRFGIQLTWIR